MLNSHLHWFVFRPFNGLAQLNPDETFELLGLSEERVNEFITKNVTAEKRENVQTILSLNPILKSVCSITFYASMLCKVLQEETEAVRLNISTYSQVTAFLILVSTFIGLQNIEYLVRTISKTAVVPIPTTAHRPFIELPWGDC